MKKEALKNTQIGKLETIINKNNKDDQIKII